MKVAIVGAGFSGLGMGVALRREGIDDFRVFERASDLGGVWHHNTYPGAACDVPSYLYSYSYEQRRHWQRPCSPQEEIADYLHEVARKHGVAQKIAFDTEITAAGWDEDERRWTLTTAAGETHQAEALVLACGQLSRPRWPAIPGMDEFGGHAFHSAEWDHAHDLTGRRVAVIGTGASAIQFVPAIAEQVAQLDVYQRSPPWMLPRANPTYPRWALAAIRWVPGLQLLRRLYIYLFMEYVIAGLTRVPAIRAGMRLWSKLFMDMQVKDPALRRKTRPDYPYGCKRILFSSNYLPALQRPNVDLVTDRIERITQAGVVTADGRERPVDTIIYGTGFKANDFIAPMEVSGRGGLSLNEAWRGGAEAHLGITVAGFPNMFLLYGPNTNLAVGSIIVMIEAQIGYAIDALRALRARGAAAIEVKPDAQSRSSEDIQAAFRGSVWTNCNSWYRAGGDGRITNNWPYFMGTYRKATESVDLDEYELTPA